MKVKAKLNKDDVRYVEDVSHVIEDILRKESIDWIVSDAAADGRIKVSNRKTKTIFKITFIGDAFLVAIDKPVKDVLAKINKKTKDIEREVLKPIIWKQNDIEKQLKLDEIKKNPGKFLQDPLSDLSNLFKKDPYPFHHLGASMKKLIKALSKKGEKKLIIKIAKTLVKATKYEEDEDVINYMAGSLEDNKNNLKGSYSLFIDESKIDFNSCEFYVQDQDGEEHGRLLTSFDSKHGASEVVISWGKFKNIEKFDNPKLEKALISFLKKKTMVFDLEDISENARVIENEVDNYVNNLVISIIKYLK